MRLLIALALAAAATTATAQTYPSQSETPVTDDAELLNPVQEAELAERIVTLEQESGSDIAVVTLPATQFYTMGDDLDVYASGLAEAWDLGATVGGRSVLLLVFRDDRELHLGIGTGFEAERVAEAEGIVADVILPAFREDDYPRGISAGIEAVNTRILTAAAAAEPATSEAPAAGGEGGGGNALLWIGGVVLALVAGIVGLNRRAKAKLAATPCPACGKTGTLGKERVTLAEATETAEGRGEVRTTCSACGHTEAEPFSIAKLAPKPSEKKSEGGGASGEW